jgi:hypothetical protein
MKALKNILTAKHAFVAEGPAWAYAVAGAAPAAEAANKAAGAGTHLKNVALFLAAPFVGLFYLMTFPLFGLAMLAWMAGKKLLANEKTRPVVLAIAAPFASIAFVTIGPVVGLGALAWIGGRALLKT